ncbi:MAG: thioester reductase domain-containing protein, partial [Chitinophagaceae bacterium]
VAQTASQCFDISVWQFFAALLTGGQVYIYEDEVVHNPHELLNTADKDGITILEIVPSLLQVMLEELTAKEHPALRQMRWLIPTGEALPPALCNRWFELYPHVPLLNAYGPTECSDDVTHYALYAPPSADTSTVPIGRPVNNAKLYILDAFLQPVPVGVTGEIYVGGICVGRGYLNNAALTDKTFITDPFSTGPDARLYKTGDLGRYLADGNILFLGRIDNQVKLRGFRIELDEIEAVINKHPFIHQSVVTARKDTNGLSHLVAYIVFHKDETLAVSDLKSYLKEQLPEYMVPSLYVTLDALPLTSNGKTDRNALPAPAGQLERSVPYKAPETTTEIILAELWAEMLGLQQVGVNDNFFEIGGHSLMVVKLITRIRETFSIQLPIRSLYEALTIAELGEVIDRISDQPENAIVSAIDLNKEVFLDDDIQPAHASHQTFANNNLFLTGATGFLGAYLLHELLEQTNATVYCHVRASNTDDGFEKIKSNLVRYKLWNAAQASRIVAVPGDLSKPALGLSASQFDELSRIVDVVYHNGALVNFTYPYQLLKKPNVDGTREVLRFACHGKLKPVHYVSTVGVFYPSAEADMRIIHEDDPPGDGNLLFDGYSQSKWVAEKIVNIAQSRGLPVTIYRPGKVTADSKTGEGGPDDFATAIMKSCLKTRIMPDLNPFVDMTPVDYVSKAMVRLSLCKEQCGKSFNLVNPNPMRLQKIVSALSSFGYYLQQHPFEEWVDGLIRYSEQTESKSMSWLPMITEKMSDGTSLVAFYLKGNYKFDSNNTVQALDGTGIACPTVRKLLENYLIHLLKTPEYATLKGNHAVKQPGL